MRATCVSLSRSLSLINAIVISFFRCPIINAIAFTRHNHFRSLSAPLCSSADAELSLINPLIYFLITRASAFCIIRCMFHCWPYDLINGYRFTYDSSSLYCQSILHHFLKVSVNAKRQDRSWCIAIIRVLSSLYLCDRINSLSSIHLLRHILLISHGTLGYQFLI